jgi:hypothetical protein
MRCIFVEDWGCPVKASKIPYEVCRLCLDARRIWLEQSKTMEITNARVKAPQLVTPPPSIKELVVYKSELRANPSSSARKAWKDRVQTRMRPQR